MRIRNGFEEFFCLRSNLSNDNIISAQGPGLKSGMDFEGTTRVFKSIYRKRNMQIRNALEEFF